MEQPGWGKIWLSFVNEKEVEDSQFPVHLALLAEYQSRDKSLQKHMVKTGGKGYTSESVEGVEVVHYKNKIYIPGALKGVRVRWVPG